MAYFRMFYRIAAVVGIIVILVKVFNVQFSLWWAVPLVAVVWLVTEIRAAYVNAKIKENKSSSEQAPPVVDLKKDVDGSWKDPSTDDSKT